MVGLPLNPSSPTPSPTQAGRGGLHVNGPHPCPSPSERGKNRCNHNVVRPFSLGEKGLGVEGLIIARLLALIVLLTFALSGGAFAQEATPEAAPYAPTEIVTFREAYVFAGPGPTHLQVGVLRENVPVRVIERNNPGTWVHIQRENEGGNVTLDGWIISGYIQGRSALDFGTMPITALPDNVPEGAPNQALRDIYIAPILPVISDAMVDVWWLGQALGNGPDTITKVGDSLSAQREYLEPMANPSRALNAFRYLSPVIDRFGPSTAGGSIAAQVGMGSFTMFDPMWADPARGCQPGEGPLACEYRVKQPGIAFIMFGPNDVRAISADVYAQEMERIIIASLDSGVIPVVSTFAVHPNDPFQPQALLFNKRLIEVASRHQIPLINLWAATRVLPNYGLDTDNVHLTMSGNDQLYYDSGNDAFSGVALHNLLSIATLQLIVEKLRVES